MFNGSISEFKPCHILLLKMSAFNYVVLILFYCSLNKFNLEILLEICAFIKYFIYVTKANSMILRVLSP